MDGNSPCEDLEELRAKIAKKTSQGKISSSQQDALNASIDHIKLEYPC